MDEIKKLTDDYLVDEFGRVIIQDVELFEQINGAGDPIFNAFASNSGCGSNGACANAGCKKINS